MGGLHWQGGFLNRELDPSSAEVRVDSDFSFAWQQAFIGAFTERFTLFCRVQQQSRKKTDGTNSATISASIKLCRTKPISVSDPLK
jgi:hypothetical protein